MQAILAGPAFAQLQSQGSARVAWVSASSMQDGTLFLDELRRGLREHGWVENRNLVLSTYWGDYSVPLLERKVGEAIAGRPDVIVCQGTAADPTRKVTQTIPIVFGFSGDPVEAGFVRSLAHPGGNLTGMSYMALELVGKRMQLLHDVLPNARRVAVLSFPQHPGDQTEKRAAQAAAARLGLSLEQYDIRGADEMTRALGLIAQGKPDAVLAFPVQNVIARREAIAQWSLQNRIPVISGWAQFAQGGNLMSYGPNLRAANFRLASFVDRILKGALPSALPVEYPVQVELVINMRAANALGITVPAAVLLRADEVIA
ncbi:MAG: ABC transporter substrate-binding protein [Betaproteobacteria bacterium]